VSQFVSASHLRAASGFAFLPLGANVEPVNRINQSTLSSMVWGYAPDLVAISDIEPPVPAGGCAVASIVFHPGSRSADIFSQGSSKTQIFNPGVREAEKVC
tara:strand:+ start:67618 stop:67920 length:303 start_codon:yes stop_codon:yes gene_type:complete